MIGIIGTLVALVAVMVVTFGISGRNQSKVDALSESRKIRDAEIVKQHKAKFPEKEDVSEPFVVDDIPAGA